MGYDTVFHFIAREFAAAKILHILTGGYAVNYHGYSRNTFDVDFLIQDTQRPMALKTLEAVGYKEFESADSYSRLQSKQANRKSLDLVYVDGQTFGRVHEESVDVQLMGLGFKVPSLMHLLAMKCHALRNNFKGRWMKDLVDVVELVRQAQMDVKGEEFRSMCMKFGGQKVYDKILEGVGH
jgi:hypothetical protein